jgi:hypothetical protein
VKSRRKNWARVVLRGCFLWFECVLWCIIVDYTVPAFENGYNRQLGQWRGMECGSVGALDFYMKCLREEKNTKLTLSPVGLDICNSEIIWVIECATGLGYDSRIWARDVGCAKNPRSVPNFHMWFFDFPMKCFWLKIWMMARKKSKFINRRIEAHYRLDIAIHMMSWGGFIGNLL